jgi:hypothetical protein
MHLPGKIGFQPRPKPAAALPFTRVLICGGITSQAQQELGTAGCVAAFVERLGQQTPPPRINGLPHISGQGFAVEFSVCYGFAHDAYTVLTNEPAVILPLTAALLAATSPLAMPDKSTAYDWAAISKSFEFTMMGRITDTTAAEYAQPRTYPLNQAPSPAHVELSQLLHELRTLSVRVAPEVLKANAARVEELTGAIDQVKRRIWEA